MSPGSRSCCASLSRRRGSRRRSRRIDFQQHVVDHPFLGVLPDSADSRVPLTHPCKLRDLHVVLKLFIVANVEVQAISRRSSVPARKRYQARCPTTHP
eukprot:13554529-Heterocapsa_arctica.AAC.1